MNSAGRARFAAVLLVLLGAGLVSPFRARDWLQRVARLRAGLSYSAPEPPPGPSAFAFDPRYAAFLEALRRATPPGATVALSTPAGELYLFEAAYRLAPRRIVPIAAAAQAGFVARYGAERVGFGGILLPGGALERR